MAAYVKQRQVAEQFVSSWTGKGHIIRTEQAIPASRGIRDCRAGGAHHFWGAISH